MAQINISASELNVVRQKYQNRYMKIELLDSNFTIVDRLEGVTLNGSINVDANSDMRRSATLKFVITDSSFEVESGGRIWLDKYIRLFIGTESILENEIIYTNIGIFILDAPTYEYDAVNNSIQVSLLDLMSKLSGLRNGYLPGVPITISAGENIAQAIKDTLALGGFTNCICEEAPAPGVVPNDLTFSQGSSIYTVLAGLRDIYPNYEIYFDVNGVFHYNAIPTGVNEPVQVDDTTWESIVISEKVDVNFQNVKNYIEVYGRTHDPSYFSTNTIVNGTNITLTMEDVTAYTDGIIYGFTLTNNTGIIAPKICIFNPADPNIPDDEDLYLPLLNVKLDDGTNATIQAEQGEIYYCVQYVADGNYFRWLGHLQAFAIAQDNNPDSPFYVGSSIGQIRLPLYGGDYENCITDDLAMQRAKYELYMHTNMENSITLSCIPIPWLDVNMLVEYTLNRNKVKDKYIIKSFSYGFNITDTMSVNIIKFYPNYAEI